MKLKLAIVFVLNLFLLLMSIDSCMSQQLSQYIDPKTGVVKTPQGFASDDDCWRTSWFYSSLILIKAKNASLFDKLKAEHDLELSSVKTFLKYFRSRCIRDDGWRRPTSLRDNFSRDQLTPFLLLLTCINKHGPDDCRDDAREIVKDLVRKVKKNGSISKDSIGKVRGNLRYPIDTLCDRYDIDYLNGNVRALYKVQFTAALKAHSLLVQLPWSELATMDDYSVFNALSLVTMQGVIWGKDDADVKQWRGYYRQHADKGWGPAFKLVSGRTLDGATIDKYKIAHIKRSQDNDTLMGQRPHKYLSNDFPIPQLQQSGGQGQFPVLDYVVLKSLELVWK